jgi:hypothetical protein
VLQTFLVHLRKLKCKSFSILKKLISQKHKFFKILPKFEFLFKRLTSKEKVVTNYIKNHKKCPVLTQVSKN